MRRRLVLGTLVLVLLGLGGGMFPQPSPQGEVGVPSATPTPAPVDVTTLCQAPSEMTFLALGVSPSFGFGMGDAVRLVRVDFARLRLVVIPLPRDLYVDLPWDSAYPSPIKLTSAYFLGTPWMTNGGPVDGGVRLMAATVAYNFKVPIDRYLAVDLRGFQRFVDAIGGIPVDIPYPIHDQASGAHFEPGHYLLDGHGALTLARARMDRGGFVRAERQGWVIRGILRSLAEPETLAQLPAIVEALREAVITDITPEDTARLLCFYSAFVAAHRTPEVLSVPTDLVQPTMDWIFIGREPHVASVVVWDEAYVQWLHQRLSGSP